MKKYYLFTPGPTPIPEEIRNLANQPIIHHRTEDFIQIYKNTSQNLKYLFQTKYPVYMLLSSGTGAMETAVCNFLNAHDKIIVINAGKFGERWTKIAEQYNIKVIEIPYPWGKKFNLKDIKIVLDHNPDVKAVYTQLCETSTGVIMDIQPLGHYLKNKPQILVVDAISALGAVEFSMDKWNVDVTISASQKAFMIGPGLGFISYNLKAEKLLKRSKLPKYYFDLTKYKQNYFKFNSPFTPNIMGVIQLNKALDMIKEEGLKQVISRHSQLAKAIREGVKSIGLKLLNDKNVGNVCTAVMMPHGLNANKFRTLVKNKYNVIFAPGQGCYADTMFRIGHVGDYSYFDIIMALSALEMGLKEMGYSFPLGRSISTVEKILTAKS